MKKYSLCPKCVVVQKNRIEQIIKDDKVLIETAINMISMGAL